MTGSEPLTTEETASGTVNPPLRRSMCTNGFEVVEHTAQPKTFRWSRESVVVDPQVSEQSTTARLNLSPENRGEDRTISPRPGQTQSTAPSAAPTPTFTVTSDPTERDRRERRQQDP
ncbi:hypothetical protein AB0D49_25615 [Streptomyces sp. NPDC048290]|uniref:hypothetical protein n=1 Tax=Streptomyces sp. NPDC048290 TaxID=3155811 RepID=UPI00342005B9